MGSFLILRDEYEVCARKEEWRWTRLAHTTSRLFITYAIRFCFIHQFLIITNLY